MQTYHNITGCISIYLFHSSLPVLPSSTKQNKNRPIETEIKLTVKDGIFMIVNHLIFEGLKIVRNMSKAAADPKEHFDALSLFVLEK